MPVRGADEEAVGRCIQPAVRGGGDPRGGDGPQEHERKKGAAFTSTYAPRSFHTAHYAPPAGCRLHGPRCVQVAAHEDGGRRSVVAGAVSLTLHPRRPLRHWNSRMICRSSSMTASWPSPPRRVGGMPSLGLESRTAVTSLRERPSRVRRYA